MLTNKKLLAVALAGLIASGSVAASSSVPLDKAHNDVANIASLQRGARNFVNYCYGCHSAQYVRFNRVAADLGLTEDEVIANLMFTGTRPTDKMQNAMSVADARNWFGKEPPDLSLIARSRGTDYIYTFLKNFYVDPSRPTGMNNMVLPGASMPHVLWELQGLQRKKEEGKADSQGNIEKHFTGFEPPTGGLLSEVEYDGFVRDTVNFLDYIGEPVQMQRRRLGIGVITFLLVLFALAYYLKKEYWKDVT